MYQGNTTSRKEKVLFYLPWELDLLGGVDVVVDRLYSGAVGKGWIEGVIGQQSWVRKGIGKGLGGQTFVYLNFPRPPDAYSAIDLLRYLVTLLTRMPRTLWTMRKLAVGTVNAHFPTRNLYPLAVAKKLGLWSGRLVLSFHGSDIKSIDASSPIWRLIASQADICTCCSEALARELAETGLFDQSRNVVIHNGIDTRSFRAAAKKGNLPSALRGCFYLVNVGNFVPRKSQDHLIRAFALLARQHANLRLVCAGGTDNGKWLAELNKLCRDLEVADRVIFLQDVPRDDVATLLSNSICMVHTASHEPFGLVLIEAGSLGVPVITTSVGGIPEIIQDGVSGILVRAGDHRETANAIRKLLEDGGLRYTLGKNLQARVLSDFSAQQMCDRYLDVLSPTFKPSGD
jgi:glycosyltransferase involved in cell wall biosynthesis